MKRTMWTAATRVVLALARIASSSSSAVASPSVANRDVVRAFPKHAF